MKVYILPDKETADSLRGRKYAGQKEFNPIEDADGEWVISETEHDEFLELTDKVKEKEFIFIKELPTKEHNPKKESLE